MGGEKTLFGFRHPGGAKRTPGPSGARERDPVAGAVREQIAFGAAGSRPSPG